ncbi:MAG: hypothetical protein ACRD6X_20555, partial [Pyrinomonadaceae bacterium]
KLKNLFAATCLAVLVGISFVQLNAYSVAAAGCPNNPFPECDSNLSQSWSYSNGQHTTWYCVYQCSCPGGGGGEPFEIERIVEIEG